MAAFVEQPIVLQYLGFETKGAVREYAFSLRGLGGESSSYFVTIPNEAFSAHRARYQDAPAICSIRLRREFAAQAGQIEMKSSPNQKPRVKLGRIDSRGGKAHRERAAPGLNGLACGKLLDGHAAAP